MTNELLFCFFIFAVELGESRVSITKMTNAIVGVN